MLAEWSAEHAEGGLTELIPAYYYRLVLVPVLVDYRVLGNVNIEYVNLTAKDHSGYCTSTSSTTVRVD